jgi:hypothetical protein
VVAHHGDLFGAEHLDVLGADLPTGKEAPDQGVHVQPDVSIAQPAHDPPEGVVIEVAEGARGHAVAEVVAPAPQHRVEPAQQVCERSVFRSAGQGPHLVDDRRERLLRRVGVDRGLPASASPGSALDVPAEEVEPLIDVADPALLDRQRRPIGASTAPTSSQSASASARVPPTMTTKSSA